jgi:hypothetical protein
MSVRERDARFRGEAQVEKFSQGGAVVILVLQSANA